jgi:hypothetical protein
MQISKDAVMNIMNSVDVVFSTLMLCRLSNM